MGFRKFLLIVLLLLTLAVPSYAADKVGMMGAPNTSGVGPLEVDSDRVVTIASDAAFVVSGAIKQSVEVAVTNDTLTASESGKTIVLDVAGTGYATMTLPAATVGLEYTFVLNDANTYYIDPDGTDIVQYLTMSAGDKLESPTSEAVADSVTLVSTAAGTWTVKSMFRSWLDGN